MAKDNGQGRMAIVLNANRTLLIDRLNICDGFFDKLIEEFVLSGEDEERIRSEKTRQDRIRELIRTLSTRGDHVYATFRNALLEDEQNLDLVKALDKTDVEECRKKMEEVSIGQATKSKDENANATTNLIRVNTAKKDLVNAVILKFSKRFVDFWKKFLRKEGIEESEITCLEKDYNTDGLEEICYQGLLKWKEVNGRVATVDHLVKRLRQMMKNSLADDIEEFALNSNK